MGNLVKLVDGDRINLERISFLLVDENLQSLDIMGQIVSGFGVRALTKCQKAADAKEAARRAQIDFVIADVRLRDESGVSFVQWLRRDTSPPTRFAPVVMVTAEASTSVVHTARDAGAHFVITKPISPKVLLQRIFWIAREDRLFVDSETYAGPDRRFKRLGPPPGVQGRRQDDVNVKLGAAREPNMSQGEINALMKPTRVAL